MTNPRPIPIVESISVQNIYEAPELKPIFDEFLVELPPSMLEIIKQFAERILIDITGIKGNLELSIVVDANQVISQAINYIRDGRLPPIIELSKTPFVKLYAPPSIREETLKDKRKLEKISRKKRIPVKALKSAIEEILEHITFKVPEGYEEYKKAMELVGERDPKDVDYVWLYFSINANAIVSSDKDITETTIKTWKNMGPLKHVEVILRKGSLSFVVFSLGGSAILDFLFKTILAIISTILGILKAMWNGVKSVIAWIGEGIQNLSETQALILFMTLGAILYRFGREIKEWIENLVNSVIEFLKSVKDLIVGLLEVILDSPVARALRSLIEYSVILTELYKEINLRDLEGNVIKVGGFNAS
ncbi:PIN domain-containing protein [Thermococcus aciditolerans]|nr:PIN domain-containing protein [Thermococcus aciditolerans]